MRKTPEEMETPGKLGGTNMTKREKLILSGALLLGFGIFMFFKSTRIYSFGFYRLGGQISTGGILIALILVDVVFLVATQHRIAKILLPILVGMLVLSIILGTQLTYTGSLLDLFLMLVPAVVGLGLILRAAINKKKE